MKSLSSLFQFFILLKTLIVTHSHKDAFHVPDDLIEIPYETYNITINTKFLIYDVNLGEGTNLRRDVYKRAAVMMVKELRRLGEDWILVVPEWRGLYHWKTKELYQQNIPWSQYFDLKNMNKFIPVMEFSTYWNNVGYKNGIDYFVHLQYPTTDYQKLHQEGDTAIATNCSFDSYESSHFLFKDKDEHYHGFVFFLRKQVYARKMDCLNTLADYVSFIKFMRKNNINQYRSIFINRLERIKSYFKEDPFEGDQARRSLVIAKHLRKEADRFRREFLDSTDMEDNTVYYDNDYRLSTVLEGEAIGGPFISVHMRRNDWQRAHPNSIPTSQELAEEINLQLEKFSVNKVYVATDGTEKEVEELKALIKNATVYRYPNNFETAKKFSDMGIAIIDQWICAHARYFIGTCRSTFTYRIQEERDILGFYQALTYKTCVCSKKSEDCSKHHRILNNDQLSQVTEKRLFQAEQLSARAIQANKTEL